MKKFSKFAAKACCFALAASACVAPSISNIAPSFAINASAASAPLYDAVAFDGTMAFGNRCYAWHDCAAAVLVFNGAELELVTDGYGIDNHAYTLSKSALAHDKYREVVVTLEDDGHAIIHFLKFDQSQYGFVEYFSYSYDEASSDDVQLSVGTAFDDECVTPSVTTAPGHGSSYELYEVSAFANGLFDFSIGHKTCVESQWLPHGMIDSLIEYRRSCSSDGYNPWVVDAIINDSSHACDPLFKIEFDYGTMGYSAYSLLGNEPVFLDAAGERSYGSLKGRILVPSNAHPGSRLEVRGEDMDGNHRCFTLYVGDDLDSPLLPLGIMKTATVIYRPKAGGCFEVEDTITDGKPSNGEYLETQLKTTGGNYAIKDDTGRIIKRGNVITDGWLTLGGGEDDEGRENTGHTTPHIRLFAGNCRGIPGQLTSLGATTAQVRSILNSGTKWLELSYKPLHFANTHDGDPYDNLVYDDHFYQFTISRQYRIILLLDANGNYMPYSVSDTLGDINNDKQFNTDDYYVLKQYLKGTPVSKLGVDQIDVTINGDVNKDGKVDESDLKAMQREIKRRGLA